ncbi:cobalt/nickel transport system permease protein [Clostridium collagenovorans DSM 3089]|uniref:Cobalt/nickel transport system permease protein n=1 Tax=Clostridium collagenovorans DSM 3089 TaxID=1121306 RepID=A0A1M5TV58_9CLOT|nr:cobalt ECF transporter T component CbiQ [Clostridium collagenovorans]SHH54705.1 cobalt/nickel transport system permease protein [Clostridium collagenovorans DSM 3089]
MDIEKERRRVYLNHNLSYSNRLVEIKAQYKFCFAIFLFVLSLSITNYAFNIGLFLIISVINIYVSKNTIKRYFKSLCVPLIFLLISIVSLIISFSADTQGYITYFTLGSVNIGITYTGVETSLKLFLRTMNSISAMYFIVLTMPMNQIVEVLKLMRLPEIFIEVVVLVYRFIFIFIEEYREIHMAQYLRFGYKDIKKSYNSTSILVKCLFVRVMERYSDLVVILDTRLYQGKFHV